MHLKDNGRVTVAAHSHVSRWPTGRTGSAGPAGAAGLVGSSSTADPHGAVFWLLRRSGFDARTQRGSPPTSGMCSAWTGRDRIKSQPLRTLLPSLNSCDSLRCSVDCFLFCGQNAFRVRAVSRSDDRRKPPVLHYRWNWTKSPGRHWDCQENDQDGKGKNII